jgi:HEXXH motif-containing protein
LTAERIASVVNSNPDEAGAAKARLVSDLASSFYRFEPNAGRALRVDRSVRSGLVRSLSTIFQNLDFPTPAAQRRTLLRAIRSGPVQPRLFGAYVDLVLAIFDERQDEARTLVDELFAFAMPASGGLRVITLDDKDLGLGQADRYRRLLADDVVFTLGPIAPQARADAVERIGEALSLFRDGAPDLEAEFRTLVQEVVLITARDGPEDLVFGGASTFSLWGTLVLNVEILRDRVATVASLAHECAHGLLFGLADGGRLVENDDASRYPSPLRRDGRPMEGVAHATYVAARVVHALRSLCDSGLLSESERVAARAKLARSQTAYEQGLATVIASARFTPAGRAIYDELQCFMERLR